MARAVRKIDFKKARRNGRWKVTNSRGHRYISIAYSKAPPKGSSSRNGGRGLPIGDGVRIALKEGVKR